jgi:hypothetical protein
VVYFLYGYRHSRLRRLSGGGSGGYAPGAPSGPSAL